MRGNWRRQHNIPFAIFPPAPQQQRSNRRGQHDQPPPKPGPAVWNFHRRLDVADVVGVCDGWRNWDRGGKRSAMPLLASAKRRRRCALPAQSKTHPVLDFGLWTLDSSPQPPFLAILKKLAKLRAVIPVCSQLNRVNARLAKQPQQLLLFLRLPFGERLPFARVTGVDLHNFTGFGVLKNQTARVPAIPIRADRRPAPPPNRACDWPAAACVNDACANDSSNIIFECVASRRLARRRPPNRENLKSPPQWPCAIARAEKIPAPRSNPSRAVSAKRTALHG